MEISPGAFRMSFMEIYESFEKLKQNEEEGTDYRIPSAE